jgi:hypothetical protein
MKKNFTFLFIAALTLLMGSPQFGKAATTVKTIDVNKTVYYSASAYNSDSQTFTLQEIADALGTDTASIVKGTTAFYAPDIDGNPTNGYTANAPGFWFNKDGKVTTYGGGNAKFFAEVYMDASANTFTVNLGEYPQKDTLYTAYTTKLSLVAGEKQIDFNLTLNIIEKPAPKAVDWSTMQFVKTIDATVEETPQTSWGVKDVSIKMSEVAEALGIDTLTLAKASLDGIFYAKDTTKVGYTRNYTQNPDGVNNFWLSSDGHVATYGTTFGDDAKSYNSWYMYSNFDTANDAITFSVGQLISKFAADSTVTAPIYIVYEGKCVTVNLTLKVVAPKEVDWSKMTLSGEYAFAIKKAVSNDYATTAIALDMDDIATKMGTDKATLVADGKLWAIDAAGGYSDNYTADAPGFWFNQQGVIDSWGAKAYFFTDYIASSGTINFGLYGADITRYSDNMELSTDLYLSYGDKYVKLNVKATLSATVTPDLTEKPTICKTYNFIVPTLPSSDTYPLSTTVTVDLKDAAAALEEDATTFTNSYDVYTVDSTDVMTKTYTCTPNPGFWYNAKGFPVSWGNGQVVGATIVKSTGVVTLYQLPGKCAVGETYTTPLWLCDVAAKKAVLVNITIKFVSSVDELKQVGSADLAIAVKPDDTDAHNISLKLTDVATAFNIPTADLKATDTKYPITLYGPTATGDKTSTATADANGFWYNKSGYVCTNSDEDCMFAIQYNGIASATTQDFDNLIITLWGDVKDGDILKGTIYLGVKDGDVVKLYACNVTVYVSNDPASVNGITLNKKVSGNVYDLSGRLIQRNANDTKSLSKGIYLMNGKKFIVK